MWPPPVIPAVRTPQAAAGRTHAVDLGNAVLGSRRTRFGCCRSATLVCETEPGAFSVRSRRKLLALRMSICVVPGAWSTTARKALLGAHAAPDAEPAVSIMRIFACGHFFNCGRGLHAPLV